jgi:hypothetical protein
MNTKDGSKKESKGQIAPQTLSGWLLNQGRDCDDAQHNDWCCIRGQNDKRNVHPALKGQRQNGTQRRRENWNRRNAECRQDPEDEYVQTSSSDVSVPNSVIISELCGPHRCPDSSNSAAESGHERRPIEAQTGEESRQDTTLTFRLLPPTSPGHTGRRETFFH